MQKYLEEVEVNPLEFLSLQDSLQDWISFS